jgi:hypothetical protein
LVGGCFPNDFGNTRVKHDRGEAKMTNIDPALLSAFPGPATKQWAKMNARNWQDNMSPGIRNKVWLCNGHMENEKTELGYWWNCLPTCRIVPPDRIEGMPVSAWPYKDERVPLSSGVADPSAPQVASHEAVPGGATSAGSADTLRDPSLASLEGTTGHKKKLLVNIYVVGIARLTEFDRDDNTCSVIHG